MIGSLLYKDGLEPACIQGWKSFIADQCFDRTKENYPSADAKLPRIVSRA